MSASGKSLEEMTEEELFHLLQAQLSTSIKNLKALQAAMEGRAGQDSESLGVDHLNGSQV